ncbi:MAG: hypothetical protein QOH70_3712 [Blastocatellia bacterium]|jgi:flagellar motor protein MotB|nr:hypothetical protein [Blastocatellia bacterium]
MRSFSRTLRFFVICGLIFPALVSSLAQDKAQPPASPSSCSRENALEIIQQQIDLTKTFDDDAGRITVLLRAADLIWPYQQKRARATFSEAFEMAVRNFKEKGDKPLNEGRLMVQVPDRRYTVITGIAKRDPVWAAQLSKQILQEEADEARDKATKDKSQDTRTGEKLLGAAAGLLASNPTTALSFASSSLSYPASIYLPMFLFKLSEVDRGAADHFYQEALMAYARAPMDQFLYLSSYPFARNREVGEMPTWTLYTIPAGAKPNLSLQRLFMRTLLERARNLAQDPVAPSPEAPWSEASQMFMALTRLEAEVAMSLPDLSGAVQELKGNISSLLSEKEQGHTGQTLADPPPQKSFAERVEAADRLADAASRERDLAMALIGVSDSESLEQIEAAASKIDDLGLRVQLLSRAYFSRAQRVLKEKKIDEARKLAAKVDELDQRAYLYSQIATESLKQTKSDTQAREMLEEVLNAIAKAPNTEIKARAQLAVAYLYSNFDPSRAIAVLGDAVKTINRVESINLSGDSVGKRIEGKNFGFYYGLQTPGFNPETAFREIGKIDFDGTLYLASNLTDKSVRVMSTLALVEQCLKDQMTKPKSAKPAKSKP